MAYKLNRYYVINETTKKPYWSEIYAASKAIADRRAKTIYVGNERHAAHEEINEADYPEGCKHVITVEEAPN